MRGDSGTMTGRAVPDDFGQDSLKTSIALRPKYCQGGQPRRALSEKSPPQISVAMRPPVLGHCLLSYSK